MLTHNNMLQPFIVWGGKLLFPATQTFLWQYY